MAAPPAQAVPERSFPVWRDAPAVGRSIVHFTHFSGKGKRKGPPEAVSRGGEGKTGGVPRMGYGRLTVTRSPGPVLSFFSIALQRMIFPS